MSRYRLSNKAVDDLNHIWNYSVKKWSENIADKYYLMLIDAFDQAASKPELGKDYSTIIENLLGLKAGRHIIFYRKTEDSRIEIIRILHEEMDLSRRIER